MDLSKLFNQYAMIDATNYITSSLDENDFIMGIFTDIKKTFHIVDHGISFDANSLQRIQKRFNECFQ